MTLEEMCKMGYDKAIDDVMNMLNDIEFGAAQKKRLLVQMQRLITSRKK